MQTPPDAADLAREFGYLVDSKTPIPSLIKNMPKTLSLLILGGPDPPSEEELGGRIDQLWILLGGFIAEGLEDEFASGDPIGGASPATCVEATLILFRCGDEGTRRLGRWHCIGKKTLGEFQKNADKKIRRNKGDKKYFREHLQYPLLEALARLLLKAEAEHRGRLGLLAPEQEQGSDPPASVDEKDVADSDPGAPPTEPRRIARGLLIAAISILLLAGLGVVISSGGGADSEEALAPTDLSVELQAGPVLDGLNPTSPDAIVDLGTTGGAQKLGFQAVVRPVPGQHGRMPSGLHLVVVIPRQSLDGKSLPLAFLQVRGNDVRETGQRASDTVTISSRRADSLGLDIPTDFLVQVGRNGGTDWGRSRLLSSRWQTCSEQRCVLRLPLSRFAGDDGEAIRVGFRTLAFGLKKDAPMLVIDMDQRRIGDRFARDGELRVSPGKRILYGLYLANRGTEPAHGVVARLALPSQARLVPGSIRAATTGTPVPLAVEDNLTNGGVSYATFGPGASAHFTAIVEVRPGSSSVGEMYPHWIVESDETRGARYFDSVTTRVRG